MLENINNLLTRVDDFLWNIPLIFLILFTGIFLTVRLKGLQFSKLPMALKYMVKMRRAEKGK